MKESPMNHTARLVLDDKTYELPVVTGTAGEKAIDIGRLRADTGHIAIDDGLANTGTCESKITFTDGENGVLRYRGIPIEELAAKSSFVETAYLLVHGELPTFSEFDRFSRRLNQSSLIHEDMLHFFIAFPKGAHPMGILSTMVASLSTFYPVPDELDDEVELQLIASVISQVRTIAAFSYKKSVGEPIVYPSMALKFVPNFLNMMFSSPVQKYEMDPDIVRAIELFLLLHADHEQNCSTSTVRMTGSSRANIYSVTSAGIGALWGKRHGGANQEVIQMLEQIRQTGSSPEQYVALAKDKAGRLPGFGHRVYRTFDPRARILKEFCHVLLNKQGINDPCFDIALRMEDIALKDDYFLSRNLYPNVDFYSGLILKAVGIPIDMFTVLFAIGRTPGWLAHWREMCRSGNFKIARPRQVYQGPGQRAYVPIKQRQEVLSCRQDKG